MKKIGIITFHAAFNSGSMLQAYALQTFLQKLGYEAEIINFRSKEQKYMYLSPTNFKSVKACLRNCKRILFYPDATNFLNYSWKQFDEFLNVKFDITKEYNTIGELRNAQFNYDTIIYGSDQIWNIKATDFNTAYLSEFDNRAKKISYAVSMGPYPCKVDAQIVGSLLDNLSAISVRDDSCAKVINDIMPKKSVKVSCDPTLLLNEEDYYGVFERRPIVNYPYIYCYAPYYEYRLFSIVEKIAKEVNLPVIISNYCPKNILKKYPHIHLCNDKKCGGPSGFLNLIKYSEFSCGRSFHLLCFSLIFKKEFYSIQQEDDSRLNFILSKLFLNDRIVSEKDFLVGKFVRKNIDYNKVDEELSNFKNVSIKYLIDNI